MTTPSLSTTATLAPAIEVLGNILTRTSDSYHRLLDQPESYPLCREAGRSMRYLSDRYSQVLLAAFGQPPEFDEDREDWDDQGDINLDEEFNE